MVLLCLCGTQLNAAEPMKLTDYEHAHVYRQLQERGWQVDPKPIGKRVAFVEVYRYEVFVPFEALPLFPNKIHALSTEPFIRREIVLKKGAVFSQSDLNESVRNLRRLGVFSLVAAVPVLTEDPNTVGVFLVTRDLWSLRLESSFQLTGGVLDRLQSQLTERNLFGRGIQALVRYNMQPLFVSTGALFNNRRVMGKPYTLQVSTDAFFERKSGDYEGYNVSVYGARPIFRSDANVWFLEPLKSGFKAFLAPCPTLLPERLKSMACELFFDPDRISSFYALPKAVLKNFLLPAQNHCQNASKVWRAKPFFVLVRISGFGSLQKAVLTHLQLQAHNHCQNS